VDGFTFYHTGDTGFFSDLEYLGKLYDIDVMMLPICSNYMMGIKEASWAVQKVRPKIAIPCHYDSVAKLITDPVEFKNLAKDFAKIEILQQGVGFKIE
jgi:L-ascorbate metabolism protein UlaG (beta-lactamase superfamily)